MEDWIELNSLSKSEIADSFTKDIVVVVSNEHGFSEVLNEPNGYIAFDFNHNVITDPDEMKAQKEFFRKLFKYLEE